MRHKSSDLVRFLLEHGADPNSESRDGKTPLHMLLGPKQIFASMPRLIHHSDYVLVVARLLLERGADVNSRDKGHETPLLLAMRHKSSDLVRFLLEHGADPNSETEDGKTPLHRLLDLKPNNTLLTPITTAPDYVLVVAQLLLERGADVNSRDKATKPHYFWQCDTNRPILCVFFWNMAQILTRRMKTAKLHYIVLLRTPNRYIPSPKPDYHRSDYALVVAQLLLERGADVNSRDKGHETPLLLAMRHKTTNLARFFLEHGADPNLKNEDGKTPLHIIRTPQKHTIRVIPYQDHHDDYIFIVAQLLVEHGADVNARDNDHNTPLLLALKRQAFDIAGFLLECGANPNMENHEGEPHCTRCC
jgi:ankyrin repeat protein